MPKLSEEVCSCENLRYCQRKIAVIQKLSCYLQVAKGEPPQQPICILNIVLPDDIVSETISLADNELGKRYLFLKDTFEYHRPDPRLADMSNLLGEDWVPLATQLGLTPSEINVIKSEYPDSVAKQAQSMLRMWIAQSGNKAQGDALENALKKIGREDIIPQCLNVDDVERIPKDIMQRYQMKSDITAIPYDKAIEDIEVDTYKNKYSAEEKEVPELSDEEEDFNKSVSERRQAIEQRLHRTIPASSQRQEIVEEITTIKRQSLVEDKIAGVDLKRKSQTSKVDATKTEIETVETTKTTLPSKFQLLEHEKITTDAAQPFDVTTTTTTVNMIDERTIEEELPSTQLHDHPLSERRDSDLLEGVTQRLETTKKISARMPSTEGKNIVVLKVYYIN